MTQKNKVVHVYIVKVSTRLKGVFHQINPNEFRN